MIESGESVPFEIRRLFFLHGLSLDAVRGNHATRNNQCIILVTGACRIWTHNGEKETVFRLNEPMSGVYIPAMIWREIDECQNNSILAVLSDKHYDPDDYVRDFEKFLKLCAENSN